LIARLTGTLHGRFQILLEERSCARSLAPLEALGLTPREAEVLLWIMRGKATIEIATILGCAPGTVSKHSEHILAKLYVETRGAAAALARETVA
jgi:DNA-binding CsgD family transcriptional regulator